jgi:hypothetical protein
MNNAFSSSFGPLGGGVNQPIVVAFKNITVLTSGAPADIASVALPSWCTRWRLALVGTGFCEANSAAGTLAGASFQLRDGSNAGGTAIAAAFSGPSSTSVVVTASAAGASTMPSTQSTIYINQISNSANTGTISVYLVLLPCL